MSDASLLALHGVGHVFGKGPLTVQALSDIDLRLDPGEVALIIGPSGSGKTTLLMIAGAMLSPTHGEVMLEGASLAGLHNVGLARLRLRSIGFVFQSFNLFPALNALENVALPGSLAAMSRRKRNRRAALLLERLGLGARLSHRPEELSAGEKQRVAMARALMNDPPLLLADEPTANLDSVSGRQILQLFREIASEEGRGVLVVTHDARLIEGGGRVLRLVDGRLE
ncbi:MAG: ABC transporter ATP-binding protein [Actinomycetes bacterium]